MGIRDFIVSLIPDLENGIYMGIFDDLQYENPKYDYLEKYVHIMYKGMWTPAKYEKMIREVDAPHYFNEMVRVDQTAITRCILSIAVVEDRVKNFWTGLWFDVPQTIVSDVGALFGQSETTHRRSYHALAKNLNVDTSLIDTYPVLRDRIKYLNKHIEKDPKIIGKKRVLKKLLLFSSLVEKCSLTSQFYILMSYEKASRGLTTISALQSSTATEENIHYSFGLDLINIIKEEYPQLWEEYLIESVKKNIQDAYDAEIKLVDWFFEEGVPEHLTREEVINFVNYNFYTVEKDLGLGASFDYDRDLFTKKNEWFNIKLSSTEPDFFNSSPGGYSSEKEIIDIQNFKF